jgi:signal transduction histidine kinase
MSEKELRIELRSATPVEVFADAALLHRMFANLFDNELKHLPPSCSVTISLTAVEGFAVVVLEDDGAGFASQISSSMFQPRAKGQDSRGYGLGLAFVEAVVGAHSGEVVAANRAEGGARLTIKLPLAAEEQHPQALGTMAAAQ